MIAGKVSLAQLKAVLSVLSNKQLYRLQTPGLFLQQIRALNEGNIKWLWPAEKEAEVFHVAHQYGTRIGCFGITINSSKKIEEKLMKSVLSHLQKTSPELRVSLQYREDTLWFREELGEIDFKVASGDVADVLRNMFKSGYSDVEGVPWKVRLIPRGADEPCAMPEVKSSHPHQYDIIVSGHHAIGDGISVPSIATRMIGMLNDLSCGRDIDDREWTQFIQREEILELESRAKKRLEEDPERRNLLAESLPDPTKTPLILKAFPRPSVEAPTTKQLIRVLDECKTAALQKQSISHGISFNSCFTAVLNIALARMAKRAGICQPLYRTVSRHIVSILRYLNRTPQNSIGGYGMTLSYTSKVDIKRDFWDYAKEVNSDIKEALKTGLPMEQKVFLPTKDTEILHELFRNPPPVVHDYTVSNMANFPAPETRPDDRVIMTDAISYNLVRNFANMNLIQLVIFRGRCNITMSYATDYLADETVEAFSDEIWSVLNEVCE